MATPQTVSALMQRLGALHAVHGSSVKHATTLVADVEADVVLSPADVVHAARSAFATAVVLAAARRAVHPLPLPCVSSSDAELAEGCSVACRLLIASHARSALTASAPAPPVPLEDALSSAATAADQTASYPTSQVSGHRDLDAADRLVLACQAASSSLSSSGSSTTVGAAGNLGLVAWWRFMLHRDPITLRRDLDAILAKEPVQEGSMEEERAADVHALRALTVLLGDDAQPGESDIAEARGHAAKATAAATEAAQSPQGWRAALGRRSHVLALLVDAALVRAAGRWHHEELQQDVRTKCDAEALDLTKKAVRIDQQSKRYAGERLTGSSQHLTVHRLLVDFAASFFPSASPGQLPADQGTISPEAVPSAAPSRSDEGMALIAGRLLGTHAATSPLLEDVYLPTAALEWARRAVDSDVTLEPFAWDDSDDNEDDTTSDDGDTGSSSAGAQLHSALIRFVALDRVMLLVTQITKPLTPQQNAKKKTGKTSAGTDEASRREVGGTGTPLNPSSSAAVGVRPGVSSASRNLQQRPTSAPLRRRGSVPLTGGSTRVPQAPASGGVSSPAPLTATAKDDPASIKTSDSTSSANQAPAPSSSVAADALALPGALAAAVLVLLAARAAADRREAKRLRERREADRAKAAADSRWKSVQRTPFRQLLRRNSAPPSSAERSHSQHQDVAGSAAGCTFSSRVEVPERPASATGVRRAASFTRRPAAAARPADTLATSAQQGNTAVPLPTGRSATAAPVQGRLRPRSASLSKRHVRAAAAAAAPVPSSRPPGREGVNAHVEKQHAAEPATTSCSRAGGEPQAPADDVPLFRKGVYAVPPAAAATL